MSSTARTDPKVLVTPIASTARHVVHAAHGRRGHHEGTMNPGARVQRGPVGTVARRKGATCGSWSPRTTVGSPTCSSSRSTEAGWEVEVVHDGTAAYGRALPGGLPYDVLLLDWMLPGIDGLTVCRRLRDARADHPRADADRPRRGPRPDRRPRRRRGRLPGQAVRPRRAAGPAAGPACAARRTARQVGRRGRRPRGRPGGPAGLPGAAPRSSSRPASSTSCTCWSPGPARS